MQVVLRLIGKKTKGLFTGKWKHTTMKPPFNIDWTSENIENLGIFLGNNKPETETFQKLSQKCTKTFNYWKQFKLSKLGKARVVDIFVVSKLIYPIKLVSYHPQ